MFINYKLRSMIYIYIWLKCAHKIYLKLLVHSCRTDFSFGEYSFISFLSSWSHCDSCGVWIENKSHEKITKQTCQTTTNETLMFTF